MPPARPDFPIPVRLNLAILAAQLVALPALLYLAGQVENWLGLVAVALCYGIAMNSGYALLHEAEHNLFHPDPRINQLGGILLALFFPAPFHLLRQGHLGHHLRNRSDDEAFDFYFEGENPLWKRLQFYGILTGLFWLVIALGNFLAAIKPTLLQPKYASFDRPTAAFLASLNRKFARWIRGEALAAIALHGGLIWSGDIPLLNYALVLFGFGFSWSAMQYVHHFDTVRDVRWGARNLRTLRWLDALWLNHNWHLNHHMSPTVPWIYLPGLYSGAPFERGNLLTAYARMWRGPTFTTERIENLYGGAVIR
ncbi:MAG TPA: fatty acid desaturase [candidate division Zixibacteria bacterium]|nr:fatty acid desaturase [candidate division Zixibacteria bacterium]